ncbi:hypothetical protein PtA15_11A219 [Puccinia triticina]|uniref:CWF21 domain-containing protein n=1 Tax=Puccinia triticina TaxID=208348 RepID=A0ABY7CX45_9BASI|nr:uncharacterized protein PtA15_11A219 [Puccinia triticina]WAQ89530.1 hypothetical protein PtA15_11A219 [Puccinia triticina]
MNVLEMDANLRVRKAEMEEVRARFQFMQDLKAQGYDQATIEQFLNEQFQKGEGSSNIRQEADDSDDSDSE